MTRRNRSAFVFLTALLILSLTVAAMFVLANVATQMLFDSNHALAEARARNLTASALAWAHRAGENSAATQAAEPVELDVSDLDTPDGSVRVGFVKGADRPERVSVAISCTAVRVTINRRFEWIDTGGRR